MASYLEHMALRVTDLDWHIDFFKEVFDMPVRMQLGEVPNRKVWLHAGIQLNEVPDFEGAEGRADHMGIMTEDIERVLEKAYARGVKELPQGHNWFALPSGICIEVIAGKNDVLREIIEKEPWIEE
ncbi:VOC family protein [Anaerostipes sp.]|uniref:VOC family protein n=1 Tax=Anaerostipes sp. TaxID=1872530 RepID=UPI0025C000FC|nr:VOC family protein [Anaerostipes sp.]MBS7009385.1 VOC family protein [Anaerostipes sp.]